ncbi:MAG TPA: DUF4114 domain-containing protein [Pirellulales bacterium]|nr:DUF4114 domain-containing protein [Pirellulales bacterium]
MQFRRFRLLLGLVVVSGWSVSASAQTLSKYQPSQRPLGLPLIGQTYLDGTDATSQALDAYKQSFLNAITTNLPEHVAFTGANLNQLDPTRLYFMFDYAPRIYYIYEGACYNNALGVTIATVSAPTNKPTTGTSYTVFPFVHSSISPVCSSGSGKRSSSEPLMAGDFVQLPTVKAGQQLAFFIMANMDSNSDPADVYYNGNSNNPDNFQHLISFFPDDSQYLIIGFEDMYNGGDKDCNDLMFVVDIGPNNAAALRNTSSLPK